MHSTNLSRSSFVRRWSAIAAFPLCIAAIGGCQEGAAGISTGVPTAQIDEAPAGAQTTAATPVANAGKSSVAGSLPKKQSARQDINFDTVQLKLESRDLYAHSLLTPAVLALDGQRVRISGFINPDFAMTMELAGFYLARDNKTCCFGPNALLCDFVTVQMRKGETMHFTHGVVTVEGTFRIDERKDDFDGSYSSIYSIVDGVEG